MMPSKKSEPQVEAQATRPPAADVDEVVDGVRIRLFAKEGGYEAIAGDEDYTGQGQHNVQCYTDGWSVDDVKALARQQLGVNQPHGA